MNRIKRGLKRNKKLLNNKRERLRGRRRRRRKKNGKNCKHIRKKNN